RAALFDRLTPEQVGQLEEIFTSVTAGLQGEGGPVEEVPWRRRSSPSCPGEGRA
ncbi:MarR family transcriptional regulator, partial [Streptomyces sp. RP5T]